MLVIKRKSGESVSVDLDSQSQPGNSVDSAHTSIKLTILEIHGSYVKLAVEAPEQLKIWRGVPPAMCR